LGINQGAPPRWAAELLRTASLKTAEKLEWGVKVAGEKYLPRLDSQSDEEYVAYKLALRSLAQLRGYWRSISTLFLDTRRRHGEGGKVFAALLVGQRCESTSRAPSLAWAS